MSEIRPLCAETGHNALHLYQRVLDLQDYFNKRIEIPPDHVFTSLQDALSFSHTSAKAFLTRDEFWALTKSADAIKKQLPPAGELPEDNGAIRWAKLDQGRREANRLLERVEEILLRKVVECECKKVRD